MSVATRAHVPDLERHIFADSWHWLPEEKPGELNGLVTSWLKRRFQGPER